MKISRCSLYPAMLCVALTIPVPAQQRTIGVPTADPSGAFKIVGDPGPQAGMVAAFQDSAALAFSVVRQGASQSFNQTGAQVVGRSLNVQPTITIRPGFPVRVLVTHDLVLEPYRS